MWDTNSWSLSSWDGWFGWIIQTAKPFVSNIFITLFKQSNNLVDTKDTQYLPQEPTQFFITKD